MIELDRRTGAIEVNGDEDKVCFERSKHTVILLIQTHNTVPLITHTPFSYLCIDLNCTLTSPPIPYICNFYRLQKPD